MFPRASRFDACLPLRHGFAAPPPPCGGGMGWHSSCDVSCWSSVALAGRARAAAVGAGASGQVVWFDACLPLRHGFAAPPTPCGGGMGWRSSCDVSCWSSVALAGRGRAAAVGAGASGQVISFDACLPLRHGFAVPPPSCGGGMGWRSSCDVSCWSSVALAGRARAAAVGAGASGQVVWFDACLPLRHGFAVPPPPCGGGMGCVTFPCVRPSLWWGKGGAPASVVVEGAFSYAVRSMIAPGHGAGP